MQLTAPFYADATTLASRPPRHGTNQISAVSNHRHHPPSSSRRVSSYLPFIPLTTEARLPDPPAIAFSVIPSIASTACPQLGLSLVTVLLPPSALQSCLPSHRCRGPSLSASFSRPVCWRFVRASLSSTAVILRRFVSRQRRFPGRSICRPHLLQPPLTCPSLSHAPVPSFCRRFSIYVADVSKSLPGLKQENCC